VKFAVTFGRMHPRLWVEAAEAADRLGFGSTIDHRPRDLPASLHHL
jgi:hypothetical protein